MRKLIGAVTLALIALLGAATPASAQYQGIVTIEVDDQTVVPGQSLEVTGGGCPAGSTVTISFDDQGMGTTVADQDGAYGTTLEVPDVAPGAAAVVAECDGRTAETDVEVLAPDTNETAGPPTTPSGGGTGGSDDDVLARTGTELERPLQIGIALLAVGGVVLAATSRRRRSAA